MPHRDAVPTPEATPGFGSLNLDPRVLTALSALGYEEPTPIQRSAIPHLLAGRDVLAQAATGTGKTAAFALPLLHSLRTDAPPRERTSALVLVPTRELAMQVAEAIYRYGKPMGAVALPIYGGAAMDGQIRSLKRGVDIVIATPGRALDHIRRRTIHLAGVRTVVLDEADEMLDMGFAEDLEAILAETPTEKQVALFSATLAPRISAIAQTHLRNPEIIRIDSAAVKAGNSAKIRQVAYVVPRAHKMLALGRILDVEQPKSAIVFCRTRTEVDELTETLNARGYHAEALHGGLSQEQRDRVMKKFRAHVSDLLIATDVAARGLDVQHVSHVVNYDVPAAADAYVHRIGRTGRAGRTGTAITLAEPREQRMLANIERVTGQKVEIAPVPTVADLKARRLEAAQAALRETILAGELDQWRSVVKALTGEFDIADIAAAAVKQAAASAVSDEQEIPETVVRERSRPPKPESATNAKVKRVKPGWAAARIYIGGGRKVKIRAGDLVGAITGEAGVDSTAVGAITIFDRHSIVEVPETMVGEIIAALSRTTIKGKKLQVRRDRAV
ncbi:MAG: DEAD/DEAH box helicase [Gemmatimonadota bacterium]|nr:DEAD/DEAH box helicase [Gemmatimonadota bacterium]